MTSVRERMEELLEARSGEFFVYRSSKKDPIRWDSDGVMAVSSSDRLYVFTSEQPGGEEHGRKLVWQGRAKAQMGKSASGVALQIASKKMK